MGKPPNLYSFSSLDDLAQTLRTYILQHQNAAIDRHSVFQVAVSGGSLPATLAKALLGHGSSDNDPVRFSKWEIFFADERCVPLDHADSNYKLLKDELLDKIPASSDMGHPTVHPIDESYLDNVDDMADAYEKLLVSAFAARDSVKLPSFDLLLLGCGPDGHTCSLFPGHPLLREKDAWCLAISDAPKPPPKRITLSLPVVVQGQAIAFVATGEGKREVLRKIFDTEEGHAVPSGLVNEMGKEKVSWFTDQSATEGVSFPRRGSL